MAKSYTISDYLRDTRFASEVLIKQIVEADKSKQVITKTLQGWNKVEVEDGKFLEAEVDSPEYFEAREAYIAELYDFDAKYKKDAINVSDITSIKKKYHDSLEAVNGTVEALSGALLQIAKQGISIVHGPDKFDCIKEGSKVFASATLLDVIWEGRNQSIHFEDRKFSEEVDLCFSKLSSYNPIFTDYKKNKNMAHEIIKLLNWGNYGEFFRDMMTLGR